MKLEINRVWAMANPNTFSVKPIASLVSRHAAGLVIDPFANKCQLAEITNDLDPAYNTTYNLDALDFLRMFEANSVDTVLFDAPFSPRQVAECYHRLGRTVNQQTTQASFWANLKDEIARITRPGGKVISCGWNSNGIGKNRGFTQVEIMMVAHGGAHNDTIVVVERKNVNHRVRKQFEPASPTTPRLIP